ncbi:hypothetical protein M3202_19750 [Alkalihalobacillus oceani]|uniref:VWFA domain-containing protein n=1 Tax=Halalkalibacter oceani TaxID=1653776 RepID=A0A9X2DTR9_9BACI|nr:hypothetical protein [Halalkalibacter oceani]MCM3716282.1 hypothetical protein [Halalkalibacter oceani]
MLSRRDFQIGADEVVINSDNFDRRNFGGLLKKAPNLLKLASKGKGIYPGFIPLLSDVYSALYKVKPLIKDEEVIDDLLRGNYQFMSQIMQDSEFSSLRKDSIFDDLTSALGTLHYGQELHGWIESKVEQDNELREQLAEALKSQKELNKHKDQLEKANQDLNEDKAGASKRANNAQKKVEQKKNELQNTLQEINKRFSEAIQGDSSASFQAALTQAAAKAKEENTLVQNLLSGAGIGSKDIQKVPLQEKLQLAEQLRKSSKFKNIAQWAGRFKSIAKKKRKTKVKESVERGGIIPGNDLERLLPQEMMNFQHQSTRLDFLRRFVENETLMFEKSGKSEAGKGPIILCLDQSGSMKGLDDQSKGFTLAMAMIAKKEKRDFVYIPFDNRAIKKEYNKGKINGDELILMATSFLGGGTKFYPALNMSMEAIKTYKNADVLFVTDGEPSDRQKLIKHKNELLAFKKKHHVSIMSVLIGDHADKDAVEIFSDEIMSAKDFMDAQMMERAFNLNLK